MTWVFAVLVVLVMGGVAVIASGRGGSLPITWDDRPDVRVPEGRLVAEDVRRVRFSLALRGYRMSEVDTLLARLAEQLTEDEHARGTDAGDAPDPSPGETAG